MPAETREAVTVATGEAVVDVEPIDGGQVGAVHRVRLGDGRDLVAKTGPTPLSVEAAMLEHLATESDLPVPAVAHASDDLLLLEYVPGGDPVTPAVERDAADHLARLHGRTADACGFAGDTLSGTLRQPNPWTDSWVDFFREHRLRHVATIARAGGDLPDETFERVERLAGNLDAFVTELDAPALVHGDVWTGNLVVDGDRVAAFLDPACYYGHPAVELAYVRWTDTVGEPFFERYRERRPGSMPTATEFDVYAVLPLLEHVEHFGDEYLPPLRERLVELGY